jgi:hypothetical protein
MNDRPFSAQALFPLYELAVCGVNGRVVVLGRLTNFTPPAPLAKAHDNAAGITLITVGNPVAVRRLGLDYHRHLFAHAPLPVRAGLLQCEEGHRIDSNGAAANRRESSLYCHGMSNKPMPKTF